MALFPSFFVLESGGRYLSLTKNIPAPAKAPAPAGFLKFDEEQIWSPRVKFAAEPAVAGFGSGLFHLRSLYNNKYLVTVQIGSNSWIVASANKPEEDTSKGASCTLFQPYSLPEDDQTKSTTVRLRHVGTGISATHHSLSGPAADDDDTHQGVLLSSTGSSSFILTDSSTVLELPYLVAFRSVDQNGNYCGTYSFWNQWYNQFQDGLDIGDRRVAKELVKMPNGTYHIMDHDSGLYWRRVDDWIKSQPGLQDVYNDFTFVQIDGNVVGLRNVGNNNFCGPYSEKDSVNLLRAAYPTLSKQTRLIVEEAVIKREIKDIEYRLSDSRIYDEQVQELDHSTGTNDLPNQSATMTLQFSTTDSKTTSWSNSTSTNFGVKASFEISFIPFIQKSTIELSAEFGSTNEWGASETTTQERSSSYTVTLAPLKSVLVTLLATKGKCDVPFSYTQRDLMPSGEWVETRKDDGLFKGINSYDFHFRSEEIDLNGQVVAAAANAK